MYIFSWDERKSDANFLRRGFDFAFASLVFDARTIARQDVRRDYGEIRMIAIGRADNSYLTVVYTDRQEGDRLERRIISARRSNRRERTDYDQDPQAGQEAESRPR
jgi:uncharacterized protein